METKNVKRITDKIANALIVALVVAGTAVFALVNRAPDDGELMSKLFLIFFGAIITLQIVPGLLLLAAMIKGVFKLGRGGETAEASSEHSDKR
jgi:nitrate reductase gamma subunit